ncbi:hypothetical protein ID866_5859, partial [Astraeus odoratus]
MDFSQWIPLLDSSNVEMNDWIRIATEIELNYAMFDAFVILHGTDTMSYTSSALSFLLEDLGKTVILTGAQIPLSQLRNDAIDNLLGALSIAGNYIIPDMNPHVATLRLFPGMTGVTASAFLAPPARGVVLETFGSGNASQRADLMKALKDACDAGVVIVAITQCTKGSVSAAYHTGRTLQQVGVVAGGDMTPECALTKLSYLLSKPELSVAQVRELIGTPLRGELTCQTLSVPDHPTSTQVLRSMQNLLQYFVRLTSARRQAPLIMLSSDTIDGAAQDAAAPWSRTAAETALTEASLLPFLVHLAAARNDPETIEFCLDVSASWEMDDKVPIAIPGGIVNCLDPGSSRSPLHVAALNGS